MWHRGMDARWNAVKSELQLASSQLIPEYVLLPKMVDMALYSSHSSSFENPTYI
jgi:hypothetical protein